jgi:hypothetical protein
MSYSQEDDGRDPFGTFMLPSFHFESMSRIQHDGQEIKTCNDVTLVLMRCIDTNFSWMDITKMTLVLYILFSLS